MAVDDDVTYGFSIGDANALANAIGQRDFVVKLIDEPLGGGGGCGSIQIEITSVSVITRATVKILARPCGCDVVPEEVSESVVVYDLAGCFLDETPLSALVGRRGTAQYMEIKAAEAAEINVTIPDGETTICVWLFTGLCCP